MAKVGRPPKYDTPEQMQKVIDEYFKECREDKRPFTMSGLAYALDMSRRALIDYKKKDEFLPTLKKARRIVEMFVEEMMLDRNKFTAGVIFNAKNNFSWKDKSEVDNNVRVAKPLLDALHNNDSTEEADETE